MKKLTAIVVDDDKDITQITADLLELRNLEVLGLGYDGNDAIRLFKEKSPDLVFLDVNMPTKDGIEALIEIKKISQLTKVVMITGEKTPEMKKILVEKNADAIIFKPFDIEKFIQVLNTIQVYAT